MPTGIQVALKAAPSSLIQLQGIFASVMTELGRSAPQVEFHQPNSSKGATVLSNFIFVTGSGIGELCSLSIGMYKPLAGAYPGCHFLAEIVANGDWRFSAIIAYALSTIDDTIIFDDAHRLGSADTYESSSLRNLIDLWQNPLSPRNPKSC